MFLLAGKNLIIGSWCVFRKYPLFQWSVPTVAYCIVAFMGVDIKCQQISEILNFILYKLNNSHFNLRMECNKHFGHYVILINQRKSFIECSMSKIGIITCVLFMSQHKISLAVLRILLYPWNALIIQDSLSRMPKFHITVLGCIEFSLSMIFRLGRLLFSWLDNYHYFTFSSVFF